MNVSDLLRVLLRGWRTILVATAVGILLSVLFLTIYLPKYDAVAMLRVGATEHSVLQNNRLQDSPEEVVALARSLQMLRAVAKCAGIKQPTDAALKELRNDTRVQVVGRIIELRVEAETRASAKRAAQCYVTAIAQQEAKIIEPLINHLKEESARLEKGRRDMARAIAAELAAKPPSVSTLARVINQQGLINYYAQATLALQSRLDQNLYDVIVPEPTAAWSDPVVPRKMLSVILGATFGLFLGSIIVFSKSSLTCDPVDGTRQN